MNYGIKIWLSKRVVIQFLVKLFRRSECGHIDTCRMACLRIADRLIEDRPWALMFVENGDT